MFLRSAVLVCAGIAVLAGVAAAGDMHVIVGFKGDVDAALVRKHGARPGEAIGSLRAMTAVVPAASIGRLRADPAVAYVEEDGIVTILAKGGNGKKPGNTTPPPEVKPWGITRVGGGLTSNTGSGIKVAIIDTGIDSDHSDLAANFKGGVDFTNSRKGYEDEHGHGTHVAGTVAAVDNDIGVIGVAPEAHLYAVRVLDRRGSGTWSAVANGITWAADHSMQIGNMSLGGGYSSLVQSACSYAQANGVLLIAAAGNGGDGNLATTETSYPAAFASVVAVGATTSSDGLASFSNTGPYLEVSAPGVGVLSTYKNDGYQTWNGTSMACPHASGVAALIWFANPAMANAAWVRGTLSALVDDAGPSGFDNGFGNGIVDFSNG